MESMNDFGFDKLVLIKFSKLIKQDKAGEKFIYSEDLNIIKLTDIEKAFLKSVFKDNNIQIVNKKITKKERSPYVKDYDYTELDGEEDFDEPVLANIEFDHGEIVYEDYTELDNFIDYEFIPDNIKYKTNQNGNYVKINERYPSIQLNRILSLRLSKLEIKHVIEYLRNKGIRVAGYAPDIDEDFDSYDYVSNYSRNKYPEKLDSATLMQKFIDYKKEKDPVKKKEMEDELIVRNLRLVPYATWGIAKYHSIDLSDAESMAYEGLIYAVKNYDPNHGATFSSYAVPVIKGYLLRNISIVLGVPYRGYYGDDLGFLRRAIAAVEEHEGRDFDGDEKMLQEIIEFMAYYQDRPLYSYNKLKNTIRDLYSKSLESRIDTRIDELLDHEEDIMEYDSSERENLSDQIASNVDYTNEAEHHILRESLEKALSTLTEREQYVLRKRFGFDDGNPQFLDEVAKDLNVSRERIRQIESKALRKLRHPSRSKMLRGFIEPSITYDTLNESLFSSKGTKQL